MKRQAPPRWLEQILLASLPDRHKESISGDLLEQYRDEQAPQFGTLRADLWYLSQSVGFLLARSFGGSAMRAWLTWISVFTSACGVWLMVMENILRHAGYPQRTAVAACVAVEGSATVLWLIFESRPIYRTLVLAGVVGAVLFGASIVVRILGAPHFEGFALAIGSSLVVQGALAAAVLLRTGRRHA